MSMTSPPELLGVLADDTRWRMYHELRRAGTPLTRRELAKRVGVSARLATFHLERLLEAELLTAHYARPPGRSGPGAGRSAKYYTPTGIGIELTVPERRYEFVGGLLLEALRETAAGEAPSEAARRVASERGRDVGQRAWQTRSNKRKRKPDPSFVVEVLAALGYEPSVTDWGGIRLGNCPFHALADQAPDITCTMNQAFLQGVLDGLKSRDAATLACSQPGDCCVTVDPRHEQRVATVDIRTPLDGA